METKSLKRSTKGRKNSVELVEFSDDVGIFWRVRVVTPNSTISVPYDSFDEALAGYRAERARMTGG